MSDRTSVPVDYLESAIAKLRYVKQQRAVLDEIEQAAQAALKEALGDNESGSIAGSEVVTWITSRPRRFDTKRFREEHPDVYDQYIHESVVRSFRLS